MREAWARRIWKEVVRGVVERPAEQCLRSALFLPGEKEEGSSREIAGPTCQVHVIAQSACHVGGQTRSKGFWTSSDTLN